MVGPAGALMVEAGGSRHRLEVGATLVVGRGDEADVHVESGVVSRRHVHLINDNGRLRVEDLGSRGGTFVAGAAVTLTHLEVPATLTLGAAAGPTVSVTAAAGPLVAGAVPIHDHLRIGRDLAIPGLSVPDLMVSRDHAELVRASTGFVVSDRGSRYGTFVNGVRVTASAPLRDGDRLTVGHTSWVLRAGALHPYDEASMPAIVVSHVSRTLASGKVLLDDVSIQVAAGAMVAVVGPSGAGKSTLLGALTGDRPATSGRVLYGGRDLATSLEEVRPRIGLVPQDDIVHRQLKLRDALMYAAQLRLPEDVDALQRARRVDEVLAELGLTEHGATRVDRLSGGQRKRASVAMELLTSPSFLLLDEPTSGLDPALDRQLMQSLRALADGGRTVIVISHNTSELHLCDAVLFLAPGGRLAYFGPPRELLAWFGQADFADAFELAYREPDALVERFKAHRAGVALPELPLGSTSVSSKPAPPSRSRVIQQCSTLMRRHVHALAADTGFLVFSAFLPIALAVLALLVPGSQGMRGVAAGTVPTGQPIQILLILVVGAVFMGLSVSIRELVGERVIFLRERAVGLSRTAYSAAKVLVLGAVVTLQVLVMLAIVLAFRDGPRAALWAWADAELAVALVGVGLANVVLGLALSGLIRTPGQTMPLLVMTVMAELVFTSGLFSLADREFIDGLSWLFPSRWGFAAAAGVLDLNAILANSDDPLWAHEPLRYVLNMGALALLCVALGAVLWWSTGRRHADR